MSEANFWKSVGSKWDYRFLQLARNWANECSKDPSTKVGAVIVREDRTIASLGYNGFPRGVHDHPRRYENREVKYPMTVHAEMNAIATAREPLRGYTLYVSPLLPCATCAGVIIQVGIQRVVSKYPDEQEDLERFVRWQKDFDLTQVMFSEAGVVWELI